MSYEDSKINKLQVDFLNIIYLYQSKIAPNINMSALRIITMYIYFHCVVFILGK